MDDWRAGQVLTEMESRERNEWIRDANERFETSAELVQFACECSAEGCPAVIHLTSAEYEVIRGDGTHFAIATDHENPVIDALLIEDDRYSTVSKLGDGGRLAAGADPRRNRGAT